MRARQRRTPSFISEFFMLGSWEITTNDYLVADHDGVIILPTDRLDDIRDSAEKIRARELHQATLARSGVNAPGTVRTRRVLLEA